MKIEDLLLGETYNTLINGTLTKVVPIVVKDDSNVVCLNLTTLRNVTKNVKHLMSAEFCALAPKTQPEVVVPAATSVGQRLTAKLGKQKVRHVLVEARAGTGKTTTMIEGLKLLKGITPNIKPTEQQQRVWDEILASKTAKKIAFVAFNNSIAAELKERVPNGIDAMTMHQMGKRAVVNAYPNIRLEKKKTEILLEEIYQKDHREIDQQYPTLVAASVKLTELCKVNMVVPTRDNLLDLIAHFDVESDHMEMVLEVVPKLLEAAKDMGKGIMDFADMIWLPVVLNLPVSRYDLLLVDERQDLSTCQQLLIQKCGYRIIAVGDERQAIYGFAGADANACANFEQMLKNSGAEVVKIPLTMTRRCGKKIVQEAQKLVPDFGFFEENSEGVIEYKDINNYKKEVAARDMILCRVTAPLIAECLSFIAQKRAASIQGGSQMSESLIKMVNKFKARDLGELIEKLDKWEADQRKLELSRKFPNEAKLISIEDKANCIRTFIQESESIADVIHGIQEVFNEFQKGEFIRLSTIHKAKGLEANNVYLLEPEGATVPHPMAKKLWQVTQEWNLRYVAITRAKHKLTFVTGKLSRQEA